MVICKGIYSLESYQIKCNILNGILNTKLERLISIVSLCREVKHFLIFLFLLMVFHVVRLSHDISEEKCNIE